MLKCDSANVCKLNESSSYFKVDFSARLTISLSSTRLDTETGLHCTRLPSLDNGAQLRNLPRHEIVERDN